MQQITVTTDANQIFKTVLNNQAVTIKLRWQDVSSTWFISVYNTENNDPYIINKRLNNNVLVFDAFFTEFIGDIIAFSDSTPDENIGRNDFETIYNLYYLTPDEVEILVS